MDLMASLKIPFHIYRLCGGRAGLLGGGVTWCFRGTEERSVAAMRGGYGKLTVN